MKIWYCLTPEIQDKLRKHLPKTWHPPKKEEVSPSAELESLEEIDRLMRQAPKRGRDLEED